MVIKTYPMREYKHPRRWNGSRIRALRCPHCDKVLCRFALRRGFVEVQCVNCGGYSVVETEARKLLAQEAESNLSA